MGRFSVYILANGARGPLITGVTSTLRPHVVGYLQSGQADRLVHVEYFDEPAKAIERDDEIQAFSREDRLALIDTQNPEWRDLAENWFERPACE